MGPRGPAVGWSFLLNAAFGDDGRSWGHEGRSVPQRPCTVKGPCVHVMRAKSDGPLCQPIQDFKPFPIAKPSSQLRGSDELVQGVLHVQVTATPSTLLRQYMLTARHQGVPARIGHFCSLVASK